MTTERIPCEFCVGNPVRMTRQGYKLPWSPGLIARMITNTGKEPSRLEWIECPHCNGEGLVDLKTFSPEEKAFNRLRRL